MTTMPANPVTTAGSDTATEVGSGTHSGREARNLAEKHRRDKLNASIQELATLVPHVAESTRRLDKTAVLRFATHGLRVQYVFGKSTTKKKRLRREPQNAQQPPLTDTLMQLLDSFFITITCHGQIVLISASVEQLLGHCQSDLYGQNIIHITHPEDQAQLRQQLIPHDMESLFRNEYQDHRQRTDDAQEYQELDESDAASDCHGRSPSPQTLAYLADIDQRLRADYRCFTVRLARAGTRSEAERSYEIVKVDGCFRRSDFSASASNFPIVSQLIRRSRSGGSSGIGGTNTLQHDAIAQAALHGISGNDIVFVAMARIIRPPKTLNRLLDGNQLEYRTRHLIDGRIVDCDQRIGIVAGYMTDEVRNLSPFSFMHQDDVRWVIVALRQMYDCNSAYGESCYRLLARNGEFIYLQTKGYLEIEKSTNKVHSFVCVNTKLSESEGRRKVQEMKNKFSVIIKTKIPSNSLQDVPASQNPQQLERIVLYLIENLQKRNDSTSVATQATASQMDPTRYAKTPPLALVPPEPASVKNSISKSVTVVNVTAAKNLQQSHRSPSSLQGSDISLSPTSSLDLGEENGNSEIPPNANATPVVLQRPSVLQLNTSSPATEPNEDGRQQNLLVTNTSISNNSAPSPSSSSPKPLSSSSSILAPSLPVSQVMQQISILKRLYSSPALGDSVSPAKRSSNVSASQPETSSATEIHSVITTSLQNLDHSLHTIDNDARSLCQQHSRLPALHPPDAHSFDQKLDAIIVEHRKQKEILVNIKSEYDVHVQQHTHPLSAVSSTGNMPQPHALVAKLPESAIHQLIRHTKPL